MSIVNYCLIFNYLYYMTSSESGQDEPNLALWLATRAGKMEQSCPLGIRALSRNKNLSCFGVLSHIINPLLTKLVRSRWLDIGLVLFLRVYGPRLRLGRTWPISSHLDLTLGQQPIFHMCVCLFVTFFQVCWLFAPKSEFKIETIKNGVAVMNVSILKHRYQFNL